jgi:hypothetical protein
VCVCVSLFVRGRERGWDGSGGAGGGGLVQFIHFRQVCAHLEITTEEMHQERYSTISVSNVMHAEASIKARTTRCGLAVL